MRDLHPRTVQTPLHSAWLYPYSQPGQLLPLVIDWSQWVWLTGTVAAKFNSAVIILTIFPNNRAFDSEGGFAAGCSLSCAVQSWAPVPAWGCACLALDGRAQTHWSSHPAFLIPLQAGLESERTKKKNYSKAVCIFICLREGFAYKPAVVGQGVCASVRAASPMSRIRCNYQHWLENNEHEFIPKTWKNPNSYLSVILKEHMEKLKTLLELHDLSCNMTEK